MGGGLSRLPFVRYLCLSGLQMPCELNYGAADFRMGSRLLAGCGDSRKLLLLVALNRSPLQSDGISYSKARMAHEFDQSPTRAAFSRGKTSGMVSSSVAYC
jgi:hypothetical protein